MSRRAPRPVARRVSATAAVVLALALALAGCSDTDDGQGGSAEPGDSSSSAGGTSSPAPRSTPTATPEGPPPSFDAEGSTTFPEVDVREVAITDTTALVLTTQKVVGRNLPDLSLVFEVPASAGNIADVEVTDDGSAAFVLELGTVPGRGTELGKVVATVRRIDLESGEVADVASAEVPQEQFTGGASAIGSIAEVTDDVAVLDLWSGASGGLNPFEAATSRHRTVVVDLASGELAWTLRPARPVAVVGDTLLLNTGRARVGGPLRGVGLADGEQRWQALSGTAQATLVGVDGDTALVATAGPGSSRGRVRRIAGATGEVTGPVGSLPTWNVKCLPTSAPRQVVCASVGVFSVQGWDLRDNAGLWRLPRSGHLGAQVLDVYDDVAYGQLADGRSITIDALTGEDIADSTTGSAQVVGLWGGLSVADGQAVFVPAVE